jgi:hypothetical protein
MRTESDDYKVSQLDGVMKYVGAAVAIIYIALGIAIAVRSEFFEERLRLSSTYSIALGCVLIAYGLFRGYRVFSRFFHK